MDIRTDKILSAASARQNCELCSNLNSDELQTKRHDKTGHQCRKETCSIKHPHGHCTLIEHLKKVLPFEEKLKELQVNNTIKQLLLNISYLFPAIITSRISSAILNPVIGDKITPYITSPLAINSMFISNKGLKEPHKPALISLSSVGILAFQQFMNLPRWLLRPAVALAVDLVNKIGNHDHVNCKKEDHKHEAVKFGEQDLIKHIRLQALVNSVPPLVNAFLRKLDEMTHSIENPIKRFLGNAGIMFLQIGGLSAGFSTFGFLIDKVLENYKLIGSETKLAATTESTVCACCGAPFCVAEAASEAGSLSLAHV